MTDNRTTELLPCPFCSSEPDLLESYGGWYIRCSCGVSMCENYSEGGFPVGEFVTETEAIAAWNTRAYMNPDGLPMGLTISDDGNMLNWRGENYVKQGTLGNGTLTAEQVKRIHEIIEKHWHDLPDEYDMPEATALPEYSYNWQAIADELNAELGSGTCKLIDTTSPANDDYWHSAMCDKCGAEFTCAIFGRDSKLSDANHCPNCGAKVVEQYKEDDNENN